ncbi:MAG: CoA transferase [Rubrivivax sp.]
MARSDDAPADLPLAGCRVAERSRTVAAAYAGRLLAAMGATVVMLEPAAGSPLREAPPRLDQGTGPSALFAYLAAGKRSRVCELPSAGGAEVLDRELAAADILIDDTPLAQREAQGLAPERIAERFPALVYVSVLPFGASGPKSGWDGEELNLIHASGEGFLLPNGLSQELFPERPPLKIYGHFAGYQGGAMAAFAALAAWWAVPAAGGQHVDTSVQDAALAVGAFALQRLGDGSLEHRATRSFRYGGVFETKDGYIELLTLEDRQWESLVQLLGEPAWALDDALRDPLERSRRGAEINRHVRDWMKRHEAAEVVRRAQDLGVPAAKYRTPAEVAQGEHERARGLFAPVALPDGRGAEVLLAPFQFRATPLHLASGVPALGELEQEPVQEAAS